jgi:hypothetical protein
VQGATPSRTLLAGPSMTGPPWRAVQLTPLSICRLPCGTTTLEFVTSGRSVAISVASLEHFSAAGLLMNAPLTSTNTMQLRASLELALFDIL